MPYAARGVAVPRCLGLGESPTSACRGVSKRSRPDSACPYNDDIEAARRMWATSHGGKAARELVSR